MNLSLPQNSLSVLQELEFLLLDHDLNEQDLHNREQRYLEILLLRSHHTL